MFAIFLLSWLAQSLTGWRAYNDERLDHHAAVIGWGSYLTRSDFWESTLQNWQSEFLAVGTMAVFTIYLRQRGSPESKPVEHHTTKPAAPASWPADAAATATGKGPPKQWGSTGRRARTSALDLDGQASSAQSRPRGRMTRVTTTGRRRSRCCRRKAAAGGP